MRYAINSLGEKIEVNISKQEAICPGCKSPVFGRKGRVKSPYWRHNAKDCDSWYEPITEWHLKWQNLFPREFQEVSQFDPIKNEYHRADIKLPNNKVIEVQYSPITTDEINQRVNDGEGHSMKQR